MRSRNIFSVGLVLLLLALLMVDTSFSQMKKEEIVSFPGVIESIPEGSKFIVVNEMRIFVLPVTNIVDENGTLLNLSDLKPKLNVTIEALHNAEGFFARKIVVRALKRKPSQ